jgi:hypothetical protein
MEYFVLVKKVLIQPQSKFWVTQASFDFASLDSVTMLAEIDLIKSVFPQKPYQVCPVHSARMPSLTSLVWRVREMNTYAKYSILMNYAV